MRRIEFPVKSCGVCGIAMHRKRRDSGRLECAEKYARRRFCSPKCRGVFSRKPNKVRKKYNYYVRKTAPMPIGTVHAYTIKGHLRNFVKVAEGKWRLNAIHVWETTNGKTVPHGYVIHHRDDNKLNDDPSNLECMSRPEHSRLHSDTLLANWFDWTGEKRTHNSS
jgi:hypothetical protein